MRVWRQTSTRRARRAAGSLGLFPSPFLLSLFLLLCPRTSVPPPLVELSPVCVDPERRRIEVGVRDRTGQAVKFAIFVIDPTTTVARHDDGIDFSHATLLIVDLAARNAEELVFEKHASNETAFRARPTFAAFDVIFTEACAHLVDATHSLTRGAVTVCCAAGVVYDCGRGRGFASILRCNDFLVVAAAAAERKQENCNRDMNLHLFSPFASEFGRNIFDVIVKEIHCCDDTE